MNVFILDGHTFRPKKEIAQCSRWELVLDSVYDNVSKISILKPNFKISNNNFVFFKNYGFIGIVKNVSDSEKTLDITLNDTVFLLSRYIHSPRPTPGESFIAEDFLKQSIEQNFINGADEEFNIPFLRVETLTYTQITTPIDFDTQTNTYSIKSYLNKLRRLCGIHYRFTVAHNELILTLEKKGGGCRNIFLNDTEIVIDEDVSTNEITSKVTVLDKETVNEIDTYYLQHSGGIAKTPPIPRIQGAWKIIAQGDDESATQSNVAAVFADNEKSRLLEFSVSSLSKYADLKFYDTVQIKGKDGQFYTTYISNVTVDSSSNMVKFKTGELRITLTDKLKKRG